MYRIAIPLLLVLQACQAEPQEAFDPFNGPAGQAVPADQQAPPGLALAGPGWLVPGYPATFDVTGPMYPAEQVYFGLGLGGVGAGPCPAALGGQCLGIKPTIKVVGSSTEAGGHATLTVTVPASAPVGRTVGLQTAAVRGVGGTASLLSNAIALPVRAAVLGCFDPAADNYNPAATVDDGSCHYPGVAPLVAYVTGDIPIQTTCQGGDYECQAQQVCEGVTGDVCYRQDYDCVTGYMGSYYPAFSGGSSDFNFAINYDTMYGYGNICDAGGHDYYAQFGLLGGFGTSWGGRWYRVAPPLTHDVAPIVEMTYGDTAFQTTCDSGDFECQAEQVCESVTGTDCIRQDYDCATGSEGSYYPVGTPGGSEFNFAITYDFSGTSYGNICCCDTALCDSYDIRQDHDYCGTGHWDRVE